MQRVLYLLIGVILIALTACAPAASPAGTATEAEPEYYENESPAQSAPAAPPVETGGAGADSADADSARDDLVTTGEGTVVEENQAQQAGTRRIVYTANLSVRADDPKAILSGQLSTIATQFGGFISGTNVYEISEGVFQADVQLRVASDQFDAAMAALRGLGTEVLSEQLDTQDVTAQYVDLAARIENMEATEEELQALLTEIRENGGDAEEILSVYRELTYIRGEIESLQGQLNVLADLSDLATINLSLIPPNAPVEVVDDEWSITRTIAEATRSLTEGLQGFTDVVIYLLISVLPLLLIFGVLAYLLFRILHWVWRRIAPRPSSPVVTPPPGS